MKPLRNLLDKLEGPAKKNKYLHTTYDAIATLMFQPNETTPLKGGVHIRDGMDLKRTMIHVVIAMQLALVFGVLNIGHHHYAALGLHPDLFDGIGWKLAYGLLQFLPMIIVVHAVGLGIEFVFAAVKGHAVEEGFLVSGMLIPLIMPPATPLWIVAVATAFAVVIAKEAFGGTGMNLLNIALTARVFVFFAYPTEISGDQVWISQDYNLLHQLFGLKQHTIDALTQLYGNAEGLQAWAPASVKEAVKAGSLNIGAIADGAKGFKALVVDGYSGATPLALAAKGGWQAVQAAHLPDGSPPYSTSPLWWGLMPGSVGETNKIFIIIGALMLIVLKVASWRIMTSMVLGCAFMGILFNFLAHWIGSNTGVSPETMFIGVPWQYQFAMGSFFFAMAFMATDPVTASATNMGKLVFGFMIGALGMVIRVLNPAYPEGWMLAILFMNVFAPLIDHIVLSFNMKKRLSRAI
ncbi:Na(+)-transporting NADH-quinone reductase subunit B [soil metagenome]